MRREHLPAVASGKMRPNAGEVSFAKMCSRQRHTLADVLRLAAANFNPLPENSRVHVDRARPADGRRTRPSRINRATLSAPGAAIPR